MLFALGSALVSVWIVRRWTWVLVLACVCGAGALCGVIAERAWAAEIGARPVVDARTSDKMAIVVQEILQDKIYLDHSGELQVRGKDVAETSRLAMQTDASDG